MGSYSGHVPLGAAWGKTEDTLEGLHLSEGLGTPRDVSGEAEGGYYMTPLFLHYLSMIIH